MQHKLPTATPHHNSNNMPTRTNKLYRDAIYKDIELTPLAIDIIDTPEFQRLDGIQQLGFASLVYRNAKHTRFDHSVGIYQESKNIIKQIRNNHIRFDLPMPEDFLIGLKSDEKEHNFNTIVEIIGIAALLHDITHIPLGHALEDELKNLYAKHDAINSLRLYNILYDENSHICKIFQKEHAYLQSISNYDLRDLIFLILKYKYDPNAENPPTYDKIIKKTKNEIKKQDKDYELHMKMITKIETIYSKFTNKHELLFEPFMSEIISNTISSDLLEYLKRDVWGTGLDYSVDSRIEKYFVIKEDSRSNTEKHLVIKLHGKKNLRLDTISTIIELMELRYALAEKVYYHKTKVAADVMLGKSLEIIKIPPDSNPYTGDSADCSINNMKESDLYAYIRDNASSEGKKSAAILLDMIHRRKIYKQCIVIPKESIGESTYRSLYDIFRGSENSRNNIHDFEGKINSMFKDNKLHVLLFCPPHKPQSKGIGVFVEDEEFTSPLSRMIEGNTDIPAQKIGRIENLNNMYNLLWKFFIFIHPDDYINELSRHAITVKSFQILNEFVPSMAKCNEERYKKYAINFDSPSVILERWEEEKYGLLGSGILDGRLLQQMREMTKNEQFWVESIVNVKDEIQTLNDYIDDLYVNKLKEYYSEEGIAIAVTPDVFFGPIIQSARARSKKIPAKLSNLPHSKELYINDAFPKLS